MAVPRISATSQMLEDQGLIFKKARKQYNSAVAANADPAKITNLKRQADIAADRYIATLNRLEAQPTLTSLSDVGESWRRFGRKAAGLPKAVAMAAQGPLALREEHRDLPEISYTDRPDPSRTFTGKNVMFELGLATSADPADRAGVIQQAFPEATFETFMPPAFRPQKKGAPLKPSIQDPTFKPYIVGTMPDPETGGVKKFLPNIPGLTKADIAVLGAEALAFLPQVRAARAVITVGSFFRSMLKYGGTSLAIDFVNMTAGGKQSPDLWKAAMTSIMGPTFDALAPLVGKPEMVKKLFHNPRYIDPKTGGFTPAGKKAAEQGGFTPIDIETMDVSAKRVFANYAERGDSPEIAARAAGLAEFNITGTAPQVIYEEKGLQAMEAAYRGRTGITAQKLAKQTESDTVKESLAAIHQLQRQYTGLPAAREVQEVAERVTVPYRELADEAKEAVNDSYLKLHGRYLGVSPEAVDRLPSIIRQVEEEDTAALLISGMPGAGNYIRAKNLITGYLDDKPVDFKGIYQQLMDDNVPLGQAWLDALQTKRGPISLTAQANQLDSSLTQTRVGLRKLQQESKLGGEEHLAIGALIKAYDNWIDDTITQGLFTGDETVLSLLKNSRKTAEDYFQKFGSTKQSRSSGAAVTFNVLNADSPEAGLQYIFGASAAGFKTKSISGLMHIKSTAGENSPVWNGLKEAGLMRLALTKRGDFVGADKFSENLYTALHRDKSIMEILYNPREIAQMERLATAFDTATLTALPKRAGDPGFENAARYTFRRFGQREAFVKGHVWRGAALQALARSDSRLFNMYNPATLALEAPGPLPRQRYPGVIDPNIPFREPGAPTLPSRASQNIPAAISEIAGRATVPAGRGMSELDLYDERALSVSNQPVGGMEWQELLQTPAQLRGLDQGETPPPLPPRGVP